MQTRSGSLLLWLWRSVRFAGSYLLWALMISLVGVGACYSCGYGAYSAYLRRHPPTWRGVAPDPDPGLGPDLRAEVDRGLAEIEAYLASMPS